MSSTGGVAAAVRLLQAGVATLSNVDLDGLSDGQQLALLRVVHPLVCRMEAQRSRVTGSVHRRGAVFAEGAVSRVAWLRSRLRMSDGQPQLRAAAAVRQVPELATAYAAGQVSYAQISVVAAVVPDIDPEVLAAGAGKLLAEQVTQLAPGPLRQVAVRVRDHFEPEAAERRARQRLEERWLSVARTFDGAVAVQRVLDPDGGELLLATLNGLMPPPVAHDLRTPAHRRADALLDLCRLAANHTPTAGGEKPTSPSPSTGKPCAAPAPPRWAPACRSPRRPPGGWPATPRSSQRCSAARVSRWTWAGRPGWSAPPNAAPSCCATTAAGFPAATALYNGPTPTTWCPGPTTTPPTWTTSSHCAGGTTPRSTKAAGPCTWTPSPTPSPQPDPTANPSTSPASRGTAHPARISSVVRRSCPANRRRHVRRARVTRYRTSPDRSRGDSRTMRSTLRS